MCGDGKYVFCTACECVDDLAGDPMCNGPCENLVEADEGELVWCDDGGLIGSGSAGSDGGLPLPPLSDPILYLCGPPDPDGCSSGLSGSRFAVEYRTSSVTEAGGLRCSRAVLAAAPLFLCC